MDKRKISIITSYIQVAQSTANVDIEQILG